MHRASIFNRFSLVRNLRFRVLHYTPLHVLGSLKVIYIAERAASELSLNGSLSYSRRIRAPEPLWKSSVSLRTIPRTNPHKNCEKRKGL
jgi:hypothetical protein